MCSDGSINSFDFDSVNQASRLFKIMSNLNRIRIIALLNENDMTVTDVSKQLSLEQSAVSHQLRLLKDANIVASTTRGKE
ncbi:metalloregulator ArsR/SmtB family transcription factor [Mycoplasmatota bacterium]|nr:metalloregulator ArsR/SmtB family transcription factor [Mycoplasmatota bacterium]